MYYRVRELVDDIIHCRYVLEFNKLSYEAIKFIKNCLTKNAFVRMSSKEALVHPWIKGIKVTKKKNELYKAKLKKSLGFLDDDNIYNKSEVQELQVRRLRKISSDIDLDLLLK